MGRAVLGVIAGYCAWTVLWLGGNAVFFSAAGELVQAGKPFTDAGPLVGVLALSIACSLAAGLTTAAIAKSRANAAVLVVAALLLVTGIGVQSGVWTLMPVWYHLAFLALIVPASVVGGRIITRAA